MPIDAPIHTNENNLPRVINAGLPVVLVFWQRDCAPCDQLMPALDRLACTYAGRALIVKVNIADEPGLAARYRIEQLPSLVFVKDGREQATARGAVGEQELANWLEYLTGKGAQPPVPTGPSQPLAIAAAASRNGPNGPVRSSAPAGSAGAGPTTGTGATGPIVLTDANFEQVINSNGVPVMVDFWAVWCGPCKMVAPVIEDLAREYAGRAVVGKLNVDENPGVASRYGIMSIPTLMIFRDGKVIDRLIGAQPGPVLRQHLAQQVR